MNDWEIKKLSDVANVMMGQSPDSQYYNEEFLGVKFLQGCTEFGKRFPQSTVYCSKPNKIAPDESILFSVRAPVGRLNIADTNYCIGRGVASIIPTNIDRDYLYLYLDFISRKLQNLSQGSTFESINSTQLNDIGIEKPVDKNEQTAIARILSTVDKAIEQTEKLIAKYQRIKTGLMQDLLTKGIDEHGNIRSEKTHKFKNSPLGRIPVEWEVVELGNLCDMKGRIGWQGYTINDLTDDTEAPTVIGGTQISKENKLDFTKSVHLKKKKYLESPEIFVNTGDIVLVKTGNTIGKTALVESQIGEATINPNTILLKNFKNIINKYLFLIMISDYFQKSLWDFVFVGAQPSVNQANMKTIKLPIPKGNEQKLIIESFDSLSTQIEEQKKKLFKYQSIKFGLMQDLLTGKVRVSQLLSKN